MRVRYGISIGLILTSWHILLSVWDISLYLFGNYRPLQWSVIAPYHHHACPPAIYAHPATNNPTTMPLFHVCPPAMHAPDPCHACPWSLPCTPCHAFRPCVHPLPHMPPPPPHMPPAIHTPMPGMFPMHGPLPYMPPTCYTCPLFLWTEGMIHQCKNITFPQLLLRTVTITEC